MADDFEALGKLGSGSFGTVFKVRRKTDGQTYVIKSIRIVDLTASEQQAAINEVNILAQLENPFVCRYYESFIIANDSLNIVMEYCNKGDLKRVINKRKERGNGAFLPEDLIWDTVLQVILGLHYLHGKKVLHRDLKSANVFLSKEQKNSRYYRVTLGDLGVAKLLETSTAFAQTFIGTPYYLSPELCSDQPYRDKSDCWALGVLIYECCCLRHPFEARNQIALILKIIQAEVDSIASENISAELSALVLWLLTKNAAQRPNTRDILSDTFVREKLLLHDLQLPSDMVNVEPIQYLCPTTTESPITPRANNSATATSTATATSMSGSESKRFGRIDSRSNWPPPPPYRDRDDDDDEYGDNTRKGSGTRASTGGRGGAGGRGIHSSTGGVDENAWEYDQHTLAAAVTAATARLPTTTTAIAQPKYHVNSSANGSGSGNGNGSGSGSGGTYGVPGNREHRRGVRTTSSGGGNGNGNGSNGNGNGGSLGQGGGGVSRTNSTSSIRGDRVRGAQRVPLVSEKARTRHQIPPTRPSPTAHNNKSYPYGVGGGNGHNEIGHGNGHGSKLSMPEDEVDEIGYDYDHNPNNNYHNEQQQLHHYNASYNDNGQHHHQYPYIHESKVANNHHGDGDNGDGDGDVMLGDNDDTIIIGRGGEISRRRHQANGSGNDREQEEEEDTICIAEGLRPGPGLGPELGPGLLTGFEPGLGLGLGLGPRLGSFSMMTADAKEERSKGADFGVHGHGHGQAMMLRQLTLKGDDMDMELKGVRSDTRDELRLGLGAGLGAGLGLGSRSGSRTVLGNHLIIEKGSEKGTPGAGMEGSPGGLSGPHDDDFNNADTIVIQSTSRSGGHVRTPGGGGYGLGAEPGSGPGSGVRTNRTNSSIGDNTPSTILEHSHLSLDDDDDDGHSDNEDEIEEEYEDDFDDVDDQQHHPHPSGGHTIALGHPLHSLSHPNQPSQSQSQLQPSSNEKTLLGSFKPSLSLVDALAADRHRLETQNHLHYQENKNSARGPGQGLGQGLGSMGGSMRERLGNVGAVDEYEHAIGIDLAVLEEAQAILNSSAQGNVGDTQRLPTSSTAMMKQPTATMNAQRK